MLRLAWLQYNPVWEKPEINLRKIDEFLLHWNGADMLILPEMFTTGFTMNPRPFLSVSAKALEWMKKKAREINTVVCGSIIAENNGSPVNRFYACFPDGQAVHYDKRHLFRMAGEDKHYTPGSGKITFKINDWIISPFICYDLRFPVWSRNIQDNHILYDLAIYVANWPKARIHAWDVLLKARSIENACYCLGVNRIGVDGYDVEYNGHSGLYDFKGECLQFAGNTQGLFYATLDKQPLIEYRQKFPVFLDADRFNIIF